MKVTNCKSIGMEVSPTTYNACTFQIIDKWNPDQHAKTCDTMFYLSDGTGAYVWDCDDWRFLDFTGVTQSDWEAKQNEAGYIKNKPFVTLGNGLSVDENGVLYATVKGNVKSDWNAANDSDAEILNKPFKTLGNNLDVDEKGVLNIGAVVDIKNPDGELLPKKDGVVTLPKSPGSSVTSVNEKTGDVLVTANDIKMSFGSSTTISLAIDRSVKCIELDDGEDLNNKQLSGWYYKNKSYYDIQNTPEQYNNMNFQMWSLRGVDVRSCTQYIYPLNASKAPMYRFTTNGSKWSEWFEIKTNAGDVDITDGTINANAKNAVLKYRILNDVIYISGSIDVVASDSNGESIKVGNIPEQYQPKKLINGVGKVHLNVGEFSKGFENAQVVVVGDENTAAKGAVMFSIQSSAKLTAGTWTFFGSYNLI